MKTFRIKEYDYGTHKSYEVQRLSIFGFWFNPDNVDAYTTGSYGSLEEAKEAISRKSTPIKTRIINHH